MDGLPTPVFLSFPGGSAGRESTCNARDLSLIPGLGRSPGEGNMYTFQYSGPENSMDCIVHWVAKSRIRLSDFHWLPHREPAVGLAWLPSEEDHRARPGCPYNSYFIFVMSYLDTCILYCVVFFFFFFFSLLFCL